MATVLFWQQINTINCSGACDKHVYFLYTLYLHVVSLCIDLIAKSHMLSVYATRLIFSICNDQLIVSYFLDFEVQPIVFEVFPLIANNGMANTNLVYMLVTNR